MIRQGVLWLVTKREFVPLGHFLLLARDWWLGLTKESTECNLYLKRRFPQIRPNADRAKITRTIGQSNIIQTFLEPDRSTINMNVVGKLKGALTDELF